MKVAGAHEQTSWVHLMACPGCARLLRVTVAENPMRFRCPECTLGFLVRRSGRDPEHRVEVRLLPATGDAEPCPYQLLQVDRAANPDAIKTAYRSAALRWHPDRCGNSDESAARFRAIAEAYALLSDPTQRAAYDARRANFDDVGWQSRPASLDQSGESAGGQASAEPVDCAAQQRRRRFVFLAFVLIGLGIGLALGVLLLRFRWIALPLFCAGVLYVMVRRILHRLSLEASPLDG